MIWLTGYIYVLFWLFHSAVSADRSRRWLSLYWKMSAALGFFALLIAPSVAL